MVRQVALVPDTGGPGISDITRVAAALQKQVVRDFGPIWNVDATVDGFARLEDVPIGYWPILVGEEGQGGGGVHLDRNNQPYALVDFTNQWPLTASHECLEMLADPFGNRLGAGDSPKPGQGRVEFLVEVCDPCEAAQFGYTVNGILVSDFYTPRYFDPSQPADVPVRYSFQGHIKKPREVLRGGYLSWHDPVTNHWFQETFFGNNPAFPDLGVFDTNSRSLRAWIDAQTEAARQKVITESAGGAQRMLLSMARAGQPAGEEDLVARSSASRAKELRAEIEAVRRAAKARR